MRTTKARRTPKVDDKRLLAYVAAAGAALVAAGPADASIIHQYENRTLPGNATEYLTIRTGSIMFNLFTSQVDSPKATAQGTALMCLAQQNSFPLNLDKGAKISANAKINGIPFNWGQSNALFFKSGDNYVGNFGTKPDGYLGLRINKAPDNYTDYYYGWIQITSNTHTAFTIYDWAYQDTLNAPIDAGQISDDPATVPEPSTLALLAMGAGGLAVMRRRKKPEQVQ